MTEQEAKKIVYKEYCEYIQSGRVMSSSYCYTCNRDHRPIMYYNVVKGEGLCMYCWQEKRKRELLGLPPKISESDIIDVKDERAQIVRDYFASRSRYFNSRKCSETFTKKEPRT